MHRRTQAADAAVVQRTLLLRPPERTFRQKVGDFFWDKRNKTCLTRTPINWLSITLYYLIFLGVVILIFYVSMLISEASVGSSRPQYILGDSPIGTSPSLNFFPLKDSRNLIWLSNEESSYREYVKIISEQFEFYKRKNHTFNPSLFKECSKPPFGYNEKAPCIFFRMNRILLWEPKPFDRRDTLPDEMPDDLKKMVNSTATPKIWFSCRGTTAKDRDHISQDFFQYPAGTGFDVSSFPFDRQRGFLDPIVAMKFSDKKPKRVIYSFTCTVWANKLDRNKAKVDVTYYFE